MWGYCQGCWTQTNFDDTLTCVNGHKLEVRNARENMVRLDRVRVDEQVTTDRGGNTLGRQPGRRPGSGA